MDYCQIELEYYRLFPHIQSLKKNHYSDKRIYEYQISLMLLWGKLGEIIEKKRFPDTDKDELLALRDIMVFIKTSIECLRDSTFNLIPYETLFCLETALKEWTNDNDGLENVLVVTNQNREYYYSNVLAGNKYFYLFANNYKVYFKQRLVLISIPKFEANDYLSNVVLYHELGHFVEMKYEIVDKMFAGKIEKAKKDGNLDDYFGLWVKSNHYREFFCDIFAAQYIRDCCARYLDHAAFGDDDSDTHPATAKRRIVVDKFLSNEADSIVAELKMAVKKALGADNRHFFNLEKRFLEFDINDFCQLIPCEIYDHDKRAMANMPIADIEREEGRKLHYLLVLGWDLWLNKRKYFNGYKFKNNQMYEIINNLIEKSISNYIVQRTWNNPKRKAENVLK